MSSAVVIDFGTDTVKFGPAGDDAPRVFPSSIGTSSAINWDAVTAGLERIFKDELKLDPATQNVFLTDSMFQSNADQEALTRILFETFEVAGLYRMPSAVTALYARGRVDGLVVDIGADSTKISPVYQGFIARTYANYILNMKIIISKITTPEKFVCRE
jgi:actin-related protein